MMGHMVVPMVQTMTDTMCQGQEEQVYRVLVTEADATIALATEADETLIACG